MPLADPVSPIEIAQQVHAPPFRQTEPESSSALVVLWITRREETMTYPSDDSRPIESEVDRAQRKEARRRASPWAYLVGLLAVAAIIALGFVFEDDSITPSFRASTNASSN